MRMHNTRTLQYCQEKIKLHDVQYSGCQAEHQTVTKKVKGKVFYGQEHPSGESTTTECGVNYQLLAVMY